MEAERAQGQPGDHIARAVVAHALAAFGDESPERLAKRLWPNDQATPLVLRAATAPADTTTSGWASQLAATAVSDLVLAMGPLSCSGELFRRAIQLRFGQSAQINCPGIVSAATDAAWVAQGAAMPVRQLSVGAGATLTPKKLAVGFVLTREILEHSILNAEAVVRAILTESIGAALDSATFDAAAASATRPAGIRNGISGLTATTGGGVSALTKDLGQLAAAVAAVGGTDIAFVAAPGEAVKIMQNAGPQFQFPVFASGQLASGIVLCVALPALVSAVDPAVRIDTNFTTALHMDDTSPGAFSTTGSPNVISAPIRSLYQTDTVAIRVRLEASWGLRAAGSVSWLSGATW